MYWLIMGISNTLLITQTNIIQSIMFINYLHEGITFFIGFVWAMQYLSNNIYIHIYNGIKGFLIYFKRCIACALNNSRHKRYPSNSLDQNNSIHGVYRVPSRGYWFPSKFKFLIFGSKDNFFGLSARLESFFW
jgi:hypothetical protein